MSHQSNSPSLARAASMTVVSSGGVKRSNGSASRLAPSLSRVLKSSGDSWRERETKTVFPASGSGAGSATGPPHFLQDGVRAIFEQQLGHALTEFGGPLGGTRGPLADRLRTVSRADTSFHQQLLALHARPSAKRNLAAAFDGLEQGTLGDDGVTRFEIVEARDDVGGPRVLHPALDGNGALADGGQELLRGKDL